MDQPQSELLRINLRAVMRHVGNAVATAYGRECDFTGPTFTLRGGTAGSFGSEVRGVLRVDRDPHQVEINIVLARISDRGARAPVVPLLSLLSRLPSGVVLLPPEDPTGASPDPVAPLRVSFSVRAEPLSLTRYAQLENRLLEIRTVAESLQRDVLPAPRPSGTTPLGKPVPQGLTDFLEAVNPVNAVPLGAVSLAKFAAGAAELLHAGSLALVAEAPSIIDLAVGALAYEGRPWSVFRAQEIVIPTRRLLEIAGRLPLDGIIVVPVSRLTASTSEHALAQENRCLFGALQERRRRVLVTGLAGELHHQLGGGQGERLDPLCPMPVRAPTPSLDSLIRFLVDREATARGGLPPRQTDSLVRAATDSLASVHADSFRLAGPLVETLVVEAQGRAANLSATARKTVHRLASRRESFAAMGFAQSGHRSTSVLRTRLRAALQGEGLAKAWGKIRGQSRALQELRERLTAEVLVRPPHQPLRVITLGPPGSGKSTAAKALGRALDVPHVYFDAGGHADSYSATSALAGSARGLVGSAQKGVLDEVASFPTGAVFEVGEVDGVREGQRSDLPAFFMRVLEEGTMSTASGAIVEVTDVIFIFTSNASHRPEDDARKRVGFGYVSPEALRAEAMRRMQEQFGRAFTSRIGEPILFAPLTPETLAEIAERALVAAVRRAWPEAEAAGHATVTRGSGIRILPAHLREGTGAREILDAVARSFGRAAARMDESRIRSAKRICVGVTDSGEVRIRIRGAFREDGHAAGR